MALVDDDQCDETRPHCQRCTAAGVECPGYVQTRKFIDQGASVRRRYAPYQDAHSRSGTAAYAGQGSEEHVSASPLHEMQVEALREATLASRDGFQMAEGPEDMTAMQSQFSVSNTPEPQYVPKVNRVSGHDSRGSPTVQNSVSPNTAMGYPSGLENPNTVTSNDRPDYQSLVSRESVSQRNEKEEFQDIFSELMTGTEHEVAFLIRHFSQVIAPWYVLFAKTGFNRLIIRLGWIFLTPGSFFRSWYRLEPSTASHSNTPLQL